jgi:hypothetical protein
VEELAEIVESNYRLLFGSLQEVRL